MDILKFGMVTSIVIFKERVKRRSKVITIPNVSVRISKNKWEVSLSVVDNIVPNYGDTIF
jgi:hypothetical protein